MADHQKPASAEWRSSAAYAPQFGLGLEIDLVVAGEPVLLDDGVVHRPTATPSRSLRRCAQTGSAAARSWQCFSSFQQGRAVSNAQTWRDSAIDG